MDGGAVSTPAICIPAVHAGMTEYSVFNIEELLVGIYHFASSS